MKDFKGYKTISMVEFITQYLPDVEDATNLLNINHYDITQLNIPGVRRVPNDLVTKEDIMRGSVLLVESKGFKHHGKMTCAYLRPDLVLAEEENNNDDLDTMILNSLYKTSTTLINNRCLCKRK